MLAEGVFFVKNIVMQLIVKLPALYGVQSFMTLSKNSSRVSFI
jgi:hypothetical protein